MVNVAARQKSFGQKCEKRGDFCSQKAVVLDTRRNTVWAGVETLLFLSERVGHKTTKMPAYGTDWWDVARASSLGALGTWEAHCGLLGLSLILHPPFLPRFLGQQQGGRIKKHRGEQQAVCSLTGRQAGSCPRSHKNLETAPLVDRGESVPKMEWMLAPPQSGPGPPRTSSQSQSTP